MAVLMTEFVLAIVLTIAVFLAICVLRDLWPPEGD